MPTGSASEKLITWGYVIITIGLILSPFFIIWKAKLLKWRWIFLSYLLSIGIFVGIWILGNWYDRHLYNNVRNSGWLMESLEKGTLYQTLWLYLIFTISPLIIAWIKYKKFNLKRFLISLLLTIITGVILLAIWAYFVAWGLGQIGVLYF
ncbi:MAG: hypothetical protein WC242_00980 [Candidatus Paceibacterota bacterium]|jgi:hypothetical protein